MEYLFYFVAVGAVLLFVIYRVFEDPAKRELHIKRRLERIDENERRAKELGLPIKFDKEQYSDMSFKKNPFTTTKSNNLSNRDRRDVHVDYECEHCMDGDFDCH